MMEKRERKTSGMPNGAHSAPLPASGIKSPCSAPRFVLQLVGIRRLVVRIKATEKDDLLPLGGGGGDRGASGRRVCRRQRSREGRGESRGLSRRAWS